MNFEDVDVRTIDKNTLVDVADVKIDMSLDPEERKKQFVEQTKNPYCYICNGFIVKSRFTKNGNDFGDCFIKFLKLEL